MPNYLCLSIDGLQHGMIGAFGNTWIQTPTLDALACQSALFDRFYAASLDLSTTLNELWQFPTDYHKTLLTDDAGVFLHEHAGRFDAKHRLEAKSRKYPVRKIEGTQFYHNIATLADLLQQRTDEPFVFWAHFKGFRGPWDFPISYRQRYQVDEDPDPYSGIALPDIAGKNIDPDVRQAVAEAYSGGVSVLDDTLSGLLAFLQEEGLDRNTVLLLMSVRGFSLGEHRYIGANEDLYGENVHLPLFIRFPDGFHSGFRSQALLQPGDVWKLLTNDILPSEPDEFHAAIHIAGGVTVMPDWFVYRKSSGTELYVKPDDRWEVNDVAGRCPHVLEDLERISNCTGQNHRHPGASRDLGIACDVGSSGFRLSPE
ncbi:MAG: sulfatase-like hydrolase/transferase [Planctomycetaceae bacterium]|nr:sulfatase-like hydrolase/transferase [Planctomycetaceae bacterium]